MNTNRGFTIIELMVAMGVFFIAVTSIYQTYHYQQRAYIKQEQVVNMQQETRASQFFIGRDIRMAGFDPTGTAELTLPLGTEKISIATVGELEFYIDDNADGDYCSSGGTDPTSCTLDARERVRFALTNDADKNGIADGFPCRLGREYNNGGLQPVAENVQALEFCYVLNDGTETVAPTADELPLIQSVFVSLLLRSSQRIHNYQNTDSYFQAGASTNLTPSFRGSRPSEWGPFLDGNGNPDAYKRRLSVSKFRCRNMGLDPFGDI